jgi:hypothetical protein
MEKDEFANTTSITVSPITPSLAPTVAPHTANGTGSDFQEVEEVHETDAITVLLMNATIIGCLLLAYYVKKNRVYFLPER